MPTTDLSVDSQYLRAAIARGIEDEKPKPIDLTGGQYGAGVIYDVAVITTGEALGHEMWIDQDMLYQVAELINQPNKGIKSRYTHPSLSGDGLGRHVARVTAAEVIGNKVVADQHFLQAAHDTPDGNLAGYLLDLAAEDPESYGLSIVFRHDREAMLEFGREHGLEAIDPATGEWVGFVSPDPMNVNNYPHARAAEVRAVDAVDEPAANPAGLFGRQQAIAAEADQLAAYCLGLTAIKPQLVALSLDADRARSFAARFLNNHQLELKPMPTKLSDKTPEAPVDDEQQTAPEAAEAATDEPADEEPQQAEEATAEPAPVATAASARDEFKQFREAFGDAAGNYFAEGLSFADAQARHGVLLAEENAQLKQRLEALGEAGGEDSPIDLDHNEKRTGGGFASKIRIK